MYSRFVTWQKNINFSSVVKVDDVNQFTVSDEAMDVRFSLKGYGFKKVGEQNRIVHHFGCYKCYYRKVGDVDWMLFAHVTSARESSEGENVYKDVNVSSGVLLQAQYEVKIVACRLIELENWAGGEVEGIASGDQFFYDLQSRQNLPNKVRATEVVSVLEGVGVGLDIIPLIAGIEFEEVTYCIDLLTIDLISMFLVDEDITVVENLNVQKV
jgi:hypothetical protein